MITSLTRRVAKAVNDKGRASAQDLQPLFPDCTPRQIIDALHHAKEARLVSVLVKSQSMGRSKGWTLAVYGRYVAPPPPGARVSSVWDLGSLFAAHA